MVKEPQAGRVKTRLGRDIGMTNAAWWFRHQTKRLIRDVGTDPQWQLRLSVSPAPNALHSRAWPVEIPRDPQLRGDLGARMRHVFEVTPRGPVVLIGGDIPGITNAIIRDAFAKLRDHDCVFGPAEDGGFWLVGMRRVRPLPPDLFDGVRWSCADTLQDTLGTLGDATVAFAATLRDVDTAHDLP
ncbi:MAG: TIGR04282 family arsenosugar biosynthesis glycosyltransferase [Rhodobacteraceae bacterium]|nr:TIGR04282 family arsenosugar biosynthesis glycosyltransferase [Paracoccaceae bacterium]